MLLEAPSRADLEVFIKDLGTLLAFEALFAQVGVLVAYQAAPGDIVYTAGTTRAQALAADGASYLRTDYPALFAAIGTVYGAADATHFNVPSMAGRVVAAKEAVATLITTAVSGFSGATLGATGGLQSHTLATSEMPVHAHGGSGGANFVMQAIGLNNYDPLGAGSIAGAAATANAGGTAGVTQAHRNVQPTIILNAFILY